MTLRMQPRYVQIVLSPFSCQSFRVVIKDSWQVKQSPNAAPLLDKISYLAQRKPDGI